MKVNMPQYEPAPREESSQETEYLSKHALLPVCKHIYKYSCEPPVRSLVGDWQHTE